MLRYKVRRDKRSQAPVFDFEDKAYALLGEFLLAEGRNFGGEIMAFLEQCGSSRQKGEFAGNVFRIEVREGKAWIINEITDRECVVPAIELKDVAEEYIALL